MAIRLTVKNVLELGDGKHSDTQQPGLFLYVRGQGKSRVFQHRYTRFGNDVWGKVGPVKRAGRNGIELPEARAIVARERALLLDGQDPRRVTPPTEKPVTTFRDDALAYHAWYSKWTEKTKADWLASLENHVFASIGDRETATLRPGDLTAVIEPLWAEKNDTASRLIRRIYAVFDHAIRTDDTGRFRDQLNPAGGLLRRLPQVKKVVEHMVAAKWCDMPGVYDRLLALETMDAYALRFLILCCAPRASEVIKAMWCQFEGDVWHVPADHMKGRVARDIPLSSEAMALLDAIRPSNPAPGAFVFTGKGNGGRMGHQAMRLLLREMGVGYDVHGFRTTFKTWGLDNLKHPLDIPAIEAALDHSLGSKVGEAYRDTGLVAHRRILSERWATYLLRRQYGGLFAVPEETYLSLVA